MTNLTWRKLPKDGGFVARLGDGRDYHIYRHQKGKREFEATLDNVVIGLWPNVNDAMTDIESRVACPASTADKAAEITKAQALTLYEAMEEMNRAIRRMLNAPPALMTEAAVRLEATRMALERVVHELLDI